MFPAVFINTLIIASAAVNFFLSWIIFRQSRKNITNLSFALFTFFVGLWAFCFYFYLNPIFLSSLIWIKIIYFISFLMIPPAAYFFSCFPFRRVKSFVLPALIYIIFCIPLVLILFFSNLWVKEVIVSPRGPETITGPAYPFYFLFIGLSSSWGIYYLLKNYYIAKGILKTQLNFIFLGLLPFAIITVIVDFIFPLFLKTSSYFWISPITSLLFIISTTYAITRYRLMELRIMIGRGTIYLFSFLVEICLAFFLLFLNNQFGAPIPLNIFLPSILIFGILLFQPIFRFFEKLASRYFYYTFYSAQKVIGDLGKRLTQFLDLDTLSSLLVNTLVEIMKLDRAVLLLRKPETGEYLIQKNIGFKEENGISLVKDNFLTIFLEKTQKPLVYEEISLFARDIADKKEKRKLERLKENMKRIEAALCLPLLFEGKIIGMIVLGNKLSGEAYSAQDIDLLTTFSQQASIAFQNARLYSEVKGFSEKLEKEVEKRTEELRKAYEELKKLDIAKSEFISIASHQLRTPLSAIKGYLSMILEGSYGELPEKVKRPMENVYQSNERLIKLVNDILSVSKIEAGEMEMNWKREDLREIIKEVISELSIKAKERNLYLKFEEPKEFPKVVLDREKIRQVILNLVDNAIRYTQEGGVTVKLQMANNRVQIVVSDTGEGLTKKEKEKIFERFSRGSAGTKFWTEGAGLGLYIARKFVEMHKGKIWAESEGRGKGSTFYVELPIR
jgi:signal transduction histidine kinase/small basic protein